jgi:hypothetical protein
MDQFYDFWNNNYTRSPKKIMDDTRIVAQSILDNLLTSLSIPNVGLKDFTHYPDKVNKINNILISLRKSKLEITKIKNSDIILYNIHHSNAIIKKKLKEDILEIIERLFTIVKKDISIKSLEILLDDYSQTYDNYIMNRSEKIEVEGSIIFAMIKMCKHKTLLIA